LKTGELTNQRTGETLKKKKGGTTIDVRNPAREM